MMAKTAAWQRGRGKMGVCKSSTLTSFAPQETCLPRFASSAPKTSQLQPFTYTVRARMGRSVTARTADNVGRESVKTEFDPFMLRLLQAECRRAGFVKWRNRWMTSTPTAASPTEQKSTDPAASYASCSEVKRRTRRCMCPKQLSDLPAQRTLLRLSSITPLAVSSISALTSTLGILWGCTTRRTGVALYRGSV